MQRTIVTNLCDRDLKRGKDVEATRLQVELVVGKQRRKLDLCDTCGDELDAALGDFLDAGAKLTVLPPQQRPSGRSAARRLSAVATPEGGTAPAGAAEPTTQEEPHVTRTTEVREWARENGYKVSSRGRIPANVTEAFNKAQTAVIDVRDKAVLSQ